jgi:hypothetical protein
MYCTSANGGVYRYIKGTSTTWSRIDLYKTTASEAGCTDNESDTRAYRVMQGSGIVSAPNVLYATDSLCVGEGVSRSVNPTGSVIDSPYVFWDDLMETVEGQLTKVITGLWKTQGSNTTLWTIFDGKKIYTLNDTLVKKVPLKSPKDGTHSGKVDRVTLEWDKLDGGKKYQLYVNTRKDFKGASALMVDGTRYTSYITKGNDVVLQIADIYTGINLYWRVRVYQCEPYRSLYSDTWTFTTELKGAEWNPFRTAEGFAGNVAPLPGATGVPLKPTFQWNSADWATGYEFVLATDADFTKVVKSLKTTNPVWAADIELAYATVYFWKVRAFSDKSESEWGVGTFTTLAKPVPPPKPAPAPKPTPPVVLPPAPAPITPAYIWAIIIIGAVLVICVIVLIVRTRRVA